MRKHLLTIFFLGVLSISLNAQTAKDLTLQTFVASDEEILFLNSDTEKVAAYNPKQDVFVMDDYEIKNEVVYYKKDSIAFLNKNKLILQGKEYKFKTKFLSFKKATIVAEKENLIDIERNADGLQVQGLFESRLKNNEILKAWLICHSYSWAKKKKNSKETWVLGVSGGVAASVVTAFL